MEGGDVPHHQHHAVARPHAETLQVGGGAGHVVGVVGVGPLDVRAVGLLLAQGHLVGVGADRVEEPADDRLPLDGLVELVPRDLAHGTPLCAWRVGGTIQAEAGRVAISGGPGHT